jgi:hypothetical protein
MSAPGQASIAGRRKRRRRRTTPIFPFVILGLLILLGALGLRWLIGRHASASRAALPPTYLAEGSLLEAEYAKYYGAPLEDAKISAHFQQASEAAQRGSLAGSASALESAVNSAAVPVVFHDLAVSYAALGDFDRAARALREVFAREPEYTVSRKFLRDVKGIPVGAAEPYTHEQEPNNEPSTANLIALRSAVAGELEGSNDPADYFKAIAPPAPRDLITIQLANHTASFAPRIHVYDEELHPLSWGTKSTRPGESIALSGGPKPNSVLYVAITAGGGAGGQYVLSAKAEQAFDRYEPNDNITSAKRITIGEEIPASIMDGGDLDFFSFQSPRRGPVTVEIRNRSNTLIPALTVYDSDRPNRGVAPEVQKPGSNVRYVLDAYNGVIYFIQISSQAGTAGDYTLRVD